MKLIYPNFLGYILDKVSTMDKKISPYQYYNTLNDDKIECNLCYHKCQLQNNQLGICGVNQNLNGRLDTLVYAHPVAINVDPIEKKPLYHMLPDSKVLSFGTVGCNFKCPFCQNWDISQTNKIDTSITVSPQDMVDLAIMYDAKSIAYTYNEPTVFYPYAKDIGLIAKQKGIKNIFVSNGFESLEMITDMASWVDAINVDLKSWDSEYYKKVLKGDLDKVKASLIALSKQDIWLEVTTLVIDGFNNSDKDIEGMARFMVDNLGVDTPWHLSAFYPDYKMSDTPPTTLATLQRAKDIAIKVGLRYIYLGNVNNPQHTRCPHCQSIVISREYGRVVNHMQNHKCQVCHGDIKGVWF